MKATNPASKVFKSESLRVQVLRKIVEKTCSKQQQNLINPEEFEEFFVVLKKRKKLNSNIKKSEAVKLPAKKRLESYADVSSRIDIKRKFGLERKVLKPAGISKSE